MAAIAEIVDYHQWEHMTAIYTDDDDGRNGIAALGDKLNEGHCKISYKAPPWLQATRYDITCLLAKVALMKPRVIVMHSPDDGITIFSVAHYLGTLGNGCVWIAWISYLCNYMA